MARHREDGPYKLNYQVDRLMSKYGLLDPLDALDVLELMDQRRMPETEAVARIRMAEETDKIFDDSGDAIDPSLAYQLEPRDDLEGLSVIEGGDPDRPCDITSRDVVNEFWLLQHQFRRDTLNNRRHASQA